MGETELVVIVGEDRGEDESMEDVKENSSSCCPRISTCAAVMPTDINDVRNGLLLCVEVKSNASIDDVFALA
jgi:hypothetical protein